MQNSNKNEYKCTKRFVWISGFLILLVFAFTAQLLAILTPSWQFAYLEVIFCNKNQLFKSKLEY